MDRLMKCYTYINNDYTELIGNVLKQIVLHCCSAVPIRNWHCVLNMLSTINN